MSKLGKWLDNPCRELAGETRLLEVTKGSFVWALDQMMQGKKVRRACYAPEAYQFMDEDGAVLNSTNGSLHSLQLAGVAATDWELYEEPVRCASEVDPYGRSPMYSKEMNKMLKAINLAAAYGAGPQKIKQMMRDNYGGDSVEHLELSNLLKWELADKDRATETLVWVCQFTQDCRQVQSSEGMYWLPLGATPPMYMSKDATDEDWAKAVREQIDEFRKKHDPAYDSSSSAGSKDPAYYCGDAGDEQPEELGEHPVYGRPLSSYTKPKCTCDIKVLMDEGCQCGAFKAEMEAKKKDEDNHNG